MSQTLEKPETIPELRAAVVAEKRQKDVTAAVEARLDTAKAALEEATAQHALAIEQAGAGQEVDLAATQQRVNEALSAVSGHEAAVVTATRAADAASSGVLAVLHRELQRQEQAAEAERDAAGQRLHVAARESREATERHAVALQTATYLRDNDLRRLFRDEINAVS